MTSLGTVYAALWAGHDLGDHVVQTDWQAANKGALSGCYAPKSARALAGHVGSYTATQAAALRVVGVRLWRWQTLAGLAFSAVTHAFIDLRWPVRWVLIHTGSAGFADPIIRVTGMPSLRDLNLVKSAGPLPIHGPYVADQALHHGCLLIAARIISGGA